MTPKDRLEVLCDAFHEESSDELRLKIHSLIKATDYIIERAYAMLKRIPGIELSQISNIDIHSKLLNFELRKIKDYLKTLEILRDTPKALVLIDDDSTQGEFWRERCELKNVQFSYYSNHLAFIESRGSHSQDDMIVIDSVTYSQPSSKLRLPFNGLP